MPNSFHVQLADAIVTELNVDTRSWRTPTSHFTAVRSWKPWYDHDDLDSLKVAVVPLTIQTAKISRAKTEYVYGIAIDMQRQLNVNASDFTTTVDELDKIAQDVADFYQDGHSIIPDFTKYRDGLPDFDKYPVLLAEREDVFLIGELKFEGTWETLITLTIKGFR